MDSLEVQQRAKELQQFLQALLFNIQLSDSPTLDKFLIDSKTAFTYEEHLPTLQSKFDQKYLLQATSSVSTCSPPAYQPDEQASSLYKLYHYSTSLLSQTIWGTDESRNKQLYGAHCKAAEE